jgi:hypothetical protein
MKGRPSKRELRAMAYVLADEIETRARATMAKHPGIDHRAAQLMAMQCMIIDKDI